VEVVVHNGATKTVLRKVIAANKVLAELKAAAGQC
jgi:hypothetical protein